MQPKILGKPAEGKPGKGMVANHHGSTVVSFIDGSPHVLPPETSPKTIKALLTIDGGEELPEQGW